MQNGPQADEPRYCIDLEWYEREGRSFATFVQSRLCSSCQAKLGTEQEERVPTVDPERGRVVFQIQRVPFGSNPLVVIRDCCSRKEEFITPRTPLRETIFRIFLANANQPLALEEIARQLKERTGLPQGPSSTSLESLRRLIEKDEYYGLRRISLPQEQAVV